MKSVLAIRHVAFEDLGSFEDVLVQEGYAVHYVEAGVEPLAELDVLTPDLLVILGGPISVYDEDDYPFIRDEVRLLRKRMAEDRPTLGICLGAQMIAKSLCARVYFGPQKEIGWAPLALTEEGERSPLAELAPAKTPVLHWHGDTFDLPDGAVRLASSSLYANQAFSFGRNTLALQFHPEVTVRGLERWFIGHTGEIAHTDGISVQGLRDATRKQGPILEAQGPRFFRAWMRSVGLLDDRGEA
jgi:GMP synthase (glutamine-hydrolysing)